MYQYRGKTALITGASSGIGEEFAHALAARGMGAVLVARSDDKLRALAAELANRYGVRAEVIAADLGREGGTGRVAAATAERGLTVDLLVNNAGFGTYGAFETLSPERERAEILLNVAALVDLSHAFLPAMLDRGAGAIVNVASTAAFQPLPYMTVYAETKAFVLSFSQGLRAECRGRGVRVLALCPGPVRTAFFDTMRGDQAGGSLPFARYASAERVVGTGLRALERDRSYVIPDATNWVLAHAARVAPFGLVTRLAARTLRPRQAPSTGRPAPAASPTGE